MWFLSYSFEFIFRYIYYDYFGFTEARKAKSFGLAWVKVELKLKLKELKISTKLKVKLKVKRARQNIFEIITLRLPEFLDYFHLQPYRCCYVCLLVIPFLPNCISDQKVRTVVVRSVQKVYFWPKISWSEVYKNCISDQIQWSEMTKLFDHY